jgi:hypothetical protein
MLKALVFKELRETAGIAIMAALAYGATVAYQMGYNIFPFIPFNRYEMIPFLQTGYINWFICISVAFASALGLWQTVAESYRGTWLFLLHRPMERNKMIALKIVVGLSIYLAVSGGATLIYALWAALPGTHATPFYWWMTEVVWLSWIAIVLCYLGAFLAGIRPGRWIGTRLLPALAAGLLVILVLYMWLECRMQLWVLLAFILLCALFINMIFYAVRTRDFS